MAAVPESQNETIWGLFERQVAAESATLFAVDEHGHELTFGDAHVKALRLAALIEQRGIDATSVVAWQFPNSLDGFVVSLALCRLGATQCPLIPILREREVEFICRQARTRLLVVPSRPGTQDFAALAHEVAAKLPGLEVLVWPDDRIARAPAEPMQPAPLGPYEDRWYYYTSGTTAEPKGAKHSDATLIAASRSFVDALSITRDDRVALLLPLTHIGGIVHVIATLLTGSPMITSSIFDPNSTPRLLSEQRATTLPGSVPFVNAYFAFADAHPELEPLFPHARLMTHGGSPKPPELHYRAKARFGTAGILSGYGMTECPHSVWNRPDDDDDDLATSEGRPTLGVELRVVDLDGVVVGAGQEGEVRLRGPQLMSGYVDATLDAAAFDELGFLRSGDLGVLDARGHLHITGRLKDIIIRNMENISALEVENLLYTHRKVKEAAVIGVPDELTGERVCAVVVAREIDDPPTLAELCAHLLDSGLSKRKLPERLELVNALPRNAMEKVRKVDLRERFGAPKGART